MESKYQYLNKKQLCKVLNISEQTFWKMVRDGMPYFRLSERTFRFDLPRVEAWIEQRETQRNGQK